MWASALFGSTLLLLAAAQSAVLTFTSVPNPVTVGQPQALAYQTNDNATAVTIILRQGPAGNLNTLYTLTTSATGGTYTWTPRTDLPNGNDYALQIVQGSQSNYFGPIVVQGSTATAAPSSSAATASATSVSSAAPSTTQSGRSTITSQSASTTTSGSATRTSTTPAASSSGSAAERKYEIAGSLAMMAGVGLALFK